jgi:hypothetical protein
MFSNPTAAVALPVLLVLSLLLATAARAWPPVAVQARELALD